MEFFSIALLFRYIEVALDLLIIIVFYSTNTLFSFDKSQENFGEFAICGAFAFSVIVLLLSIILEADKKYPLFIIIYNAVLIIFFLTAAIIILHTWSGEIPFVNNKRRNAGRTVGSFCLFQCVILGVGAFFTFKQKGST